MARGRKALDLRHVAVAHPFLDHLLEVVLGGWVHDLDTQPVLDHILVVDFLPHFRIGREHRSFEIGCIVRLFDLPFLFIQTVDEGGLNVA
jgi:hypothetical protein